MKRLIYLIFLLLIECTPGTEYSIRGSQPIVLAKEMNRFRGPAIYQLYIYDGQSAHWMSTDEVFYNSVKIRDTLHSVVITERIY